MFKNLEGARLGLFVFLGTVLIFLAIFLVGNKDSLFEETMTLKSYFSNVEGLRTGASVRLSGMDVGTVSRIELVKDSTAKNVEVVFEIQKNIANFIRLDSEASIETEGLVGAKILTVSAGSAEQEMVQDGGIISAKDPINMAEIIKETTGIIKYTKEITKDFSEIVQKINQGRGTIGLLVNDDELYKSTVNITESADRSLNIITGRLEELSDFVVGLGTGMNKIIADLDSSIAEIRGLFNRVDRGDGFMGRLVNDAAPFDSIKVVINNLVETTEKTKTGAESFMENMEALKHNWLFKSYFEQRGYWDKEDYEKSLDEKIAELKRQNDLLDEKLQTLQELGEKANAPGTK